MKAIWYRRERHLVGFILGLLLVFSPAGWAQDVKVMAEVDQTTVELGTFVELMVTIEGAQNVAPVNLPEIPGLETRFVGPSTSIILHNGEMVSSQAFRYNIYPTASGKYEIPALKVMVEGIEYQTETIYLEVVDAANTSEHPSAKNDQGQKLEDKLFIIASVPRSEYYIHEQIPLTIKLYIYDLSVRNVQYPTFESHGFSVEDYQEAQQYQQVIGGARYSVVEFNTRIYPTRTGELSFGPIKLSCDILFRRSGRRDRFSSFFDDGFFADVFGNAEQKSVKVESADLKVNVLPLPEKGRPKEFSGGVGFFEFDVSVGPKEVYVGDPITIKIEMGGTGDVDAIKIPVYDAEGPIKFYDAKTSAAGNKKMAEQVAIPTTANITEIPALSFSYFDTTKKKYKTIKAGPFPVVVKQRSEDDRFAVVGMSSDQEKEKSEKEESLGQDINFIKDRPGLLHIRRTKRSFSLVRWFLAVLYGLLWSGAVVYYFLKKKISSDVRFARRLKAPRFAREGLLQAKAFALAGREKEFYDAAFKTMQVYFSHKFHLSLGNIHLDGLVDLAQEKGLSDDTIQDIRTIFAECEQVRFASQAFDRAKMLDSYEKLAEIINHFEKRA